MAAYSVLFLLLGCGNPDAPTGDACSAEPKELQVPCRVQLAADAAGRGDAAAAEAACLGIEAGPWQEECWFRSGEELGKQGKIGAGLSACDRSGRFARFCLTHMTWAIPSETPGSSADWLSQIPAGMDNAGDVQEHLLSKYWFNQMYGTGKAEWQPVMASTEADAPFARGAFFLEAVRLKGASALDCKEVACTGMALLPKDRVGRFDNPMPIPGEEKLTWIPTFGGGRRIVGATVEEDVQIAFLEALWFQPATRGDVFAGYLQDSRPTVRYTALRLFRTLPSENPEATLTALAQDPDPVVQAHVADALRYKTWRGKPGKPAGSKD